MDPRRDIDKYFADNEDAIKRAEARERRRAAQANDKHTYELTVRRQKEKADWFAAHPGATEADHIEYRRQKFYDDNPQYEKHRPKRRTEA